LNWLGSGLARRCPRGFTFYLADPISSIVRMTRIDGNDPPSLGYGVAGEIRMSKREPTNHPPSPATARQARMDAKRISERKNLQALSCLWCVSWADCVLTAVSPEPASPMPATAQSAISVQRSCWEQRHRRKSREGSGERAGKRASFDSAVLTLFVLIRVNSWLRERLFLRARRCNGREATARLSNLRARRAPPSRDIRESS
jgi:hypothetical protein